MQEAQRYLEIVRSRGARRLKLSRVYHNLQNPELFIRAYAKLSSNKGALTEGTDPGDTIDGMSVTRIQGVLDDLKAGRYQWKPVRRTYIAKKNGKLRALGIPSWRDKLLQEVLKEVLTAYYEPQFSDHSHGFRPDRGCHTALEDIRLTWKGTKWFVEGDIRGCFDNINHDALMAVIGRDIRDQRLLKLLKGLLDAGYMEDWKYFQTYSGTPQGGVISPLLANIFLNELDKYVEEELMPQYTRGARRAVNPEYRRLSNAMIKAKKAGDTQRMLALKKERSSVSYGMPDDPNYRRLRYVRYADDFLIGFTGPKAEAEIIRAKVGEFLKKLKLELSAEKTFVTHATEQRARFLSYEIGMARADSRKCAGRRSINGQPVMTVPQDVINKWKGKVTQGQKPIHRAELVNSSDYDIVMTYQMEFQGLVNYYTKAHNVSELYRVKDVYRQSLAKTLAAKHKKHVTWVFRRYGKTSDSGVKCFEVVVPRAGKQPLVARFGAARIIFRRFGYIEDKVRRLLPGRNELIKRLLADQCEFCGQTTEVEVHHIRKLKTLINEHKGKPSPPQWVTRMAEMRRKTLVVCRQCHTAIHSGRYDGPKIG